MRHEETPLERFELALDRLDSFVAVVVYLKELPDAIHVNQLRQSLPKVANELRGALKDLRREHGRT